MLDFIKTELLKRNIDLVSCISLDECTLKRPYLIQREGIEKGSAVVFAVPYLSRIGTGKRNVSSYAVCRDYHAFFEDLFNEIIPLLNDKYPENKFAGFTDHSPIDEIEAAAKCSLGIIGENHLLITEKYSSYIFLGEIITDASLPSFAGLIKHCEGCGKCTKSCPVSLDISFCLSAITQKKNELSDNEKDMIVQNGCAWGCDKCQEVCPHTLSAIKNGTIYTKIDFFNTSLIPNLSQEILDSMGDIGFKERAYSWRGQKVIERNLEILKEREN